MGIIRASSQQASTSQLELQRARASAALQYQSEAQHEMGRESDDYGNPGAREVLDIALHLTSHARRLERMEQSLSALGQSVNDTHQAMRSERLRNTRLLSLLAVCIFTTSAIAAFIPTQLADKQIDAKLQKAMANLALGNPSFAALSQPLPVAALQPPAPAPQATAQIPQQIIVPLPPSPPARVATNMPPMTALGAQAEPILKAVPKKASEAKPQNPSAPPQLPIRVANVFTPFQNVVRAKMARNGEIIPPDWQPMFDREAAGETKGKLQVAAKFLKGEGVTRDQAFAVDLIKQAAEAGDKEALMWLANAYQAGNLGKVDLAGAAHWYELAGKAGVAKAYTELGRMYETGVDGAPDPEVALSWYNRAVAGGDIAANDAITRLNAARAIQVAQNNQRPVVQPGSPATYAQPASAALSPEDTSVNTVAASMPITPVVAEGSGLSSGQQPTSDVRAAQRMLKALGYRISSPDGLTGPETVAAIKVYQRNKMITQDGEVTPQLLENLMNDMRWSN